MNLFDYLDGLVVMKSLMGPDWTYWEKENTSKLISFYIEAPGIEITLIKLKTEEATIFSIYFDDNKHASVEKVKQWMKDHPHMKLTYSDSVRKIKYNRLAWKVTVGVENEAKLKEFFEKNF